MIIVIICYQYANNIIYHIFHTSILPYFYTSILDFRFLSSVFVSHILGIPSSTF